MVKYKQLTSVSPLSGGYCSIEVREHLMKNMLSSTYKSKYFLITIFCLFYCIKANPVTGSGGPKGCETSRLKKFLNDQLTDGGRVVSLICRPSFTPRIVLGVYEAVDPKAIVPMIRLGQPKNPMTSSGIEPHTFQSAA
jgi:hypothetical protein